VFSPTTKAYPRTGSRGFTLIELMVVVVIITILAAAAVPVFVNRMRERRVQQAAGEVASLYRTARSRALGRGAAVLVRYNDDTGFEVFESIEGASGLAARERTSEAECSDLPARSCLRSDWTGDNVRSVGTLNGTGYTTTATFDENARETLDVCFTPSGRSFVRVDTTDPLVALSMPISFRLRSDTTGRDRDVVVLPNGTARLAL
jgi:type IV fimbrial biogenesis protein FimT